MKKFECSSCEFCKNGSRYGYICTHDKVEHHAKLYEVKINKSISKSKNFIGFKMPKTCLKWCPLKES